MTRDEIRKTLEKSVDFYKENIEWDTEEINWINGMLKREREEDRRIVESVWKQGVLTEMEMKLFTKDFQSRDTKDFLKQRARFYKERKKDRLRLKRTEELLEKYL